jgi:hypothetical protein
MDFKVSKSTTARCEVLNPDLEIKMITEKELEELLIDAARNLGKPRSVSPGAWREMLKSQFLGLSSSISCRQMCGVVTNEAYDEEKRKNSIRQQGLRDGLAGGEKGGCGEDYDIGYELGERNRLAGCELSKPENIGMY